MTMRSATERLKAEIEDSVLKAPRSGRVQYRVAQPGAVCPCLAYMPQGLGKNLYPTLSVCENVDFFGRLFGQSTTERAWRIRELPSSTAWRRLPTVQPGNFQVA